MEDKIEVGEWIRTHTGEIGKVFKVELAKEEREKYPNNPYKGYWRDKYVTDVRRGYCTRQVIKKHAKEIQDLIEIGDYVNGMEVESISKSYFEGGDGSYTVWFKDIQTIVTKEQFARMEYRLEV